MTRTDPVFAAHYFAAVDALASEVFAALTGREPSDDAIERALETLRRIERGRSAEHAWIFRDPAILGASECVIEALDVRSDGRRDWLHAHLASAVAAVARFDVMTGVVERMGAAAEEHGAAASMGTGEA